MDQMDAFLRLEKGRVEGYDELAVIPLSADLIVIGRAPRRINADVEHPDVNVMDDYVSRGHMNIYYAYDRGCFMVQEPDSGSKNGTFVNEKRIEPGIPHPLKDGDIIGLAKLHNEVSCRVIFKFRIEDTTLDGSELIDKPERSSATGFSIDLRARIVRVDGNQVHLRKKEFDMLAFLYENTGKACSRDEIAEAVWPEAQGDTYNQTIDTYISRIRRAIQREHLKFPHLETVHHHYRLDLEEPSP
jgi:pSer/pThr/pTyr-binding forkhead associated (FHA) protein